MNYGSVCSGIEAATVAWHPLGWKPALFSEIDNFPRALLKQHYPTVPLHGDFTTIEAGDYDAVDLIVGGTPCQSFSVAGLRKGLADERGNLTLEFIRLAQRLRPRWIVWENVPGVLSQDGGRAFGAFLGGLAECGYGFAYRVLDAQYFGVPQRRRRVFVVGYFGDWRRAAAVLFERHSLQGHPPPSREKGQNAPTIPSRRTGGGGLGTDFDCDGGLIVGTMKACKDSGGWGNSADHAAAGYMIPIAIPIHDKATRYKGGGETRNNDGSANGFGVGKDGDPYPTLGAHDIHAAAISGQSGIAVRRLTPRECERLQGFPDDYTAISFRNKPAADGPRYKALGNSMAVPVMGWIGERIQQIENLTQRKDARHD